MGRASGRVGLVLGAGGVAGGAFHAGVLAALEQELGWDPRRASVVVGTSAGSVAGTSLRAGLSAADLLARAEGRPLSPEGTELMRAVGPPQRPPPLRPAMTPRAPAEVAATLRRAASRPLSVRPAALMASLMPEGAVSTDMISRAMGALFPDTWPDDPLWICAVRQSDGSRVVFGREERPRLADAVAASCSIPGFYAPVSIDGETYLDGGAHSPTNLDVLAEPGGPELHVVVVSSPMTRHRGRFGLAPSEAIRRWAGLVLDGEVAAVARRGVVVVAFEPTAADVEVMGPNAMDPERRAVVARRAFDSTVERLQRDTVRASLAPLQS